MKYLLTCLFTITLLFPLAAFAAEVKNVQVYQDGNRAVFSYDLIGDESRDRVKLTLTVGGKDYPRDQLHLSGDIDSVAPGSGKKIVWDVLKDFPRGVGGEMRWVLEGSGAVKKTPLPAPAAGSGRFTANGNGTVTDKQTGLVWQQQDGGSGWTWDRGAMAYCRNLTLGGSDSWRLPSKDELEGLVDKSRKKPAIDPVFIGTSSSDYWSSSSYADDPASAWYVYFDYGGVNHGNKTNGHYVRCVR